jgi:acetyl-CoA carboxylase biotin carboxyl carrier protein
LELKQVKDLMIAMEKGGIKKLRIKYKDSSEIELEREGNADAPVPVPTMIYPHPEIHPRLPNQSSGYEDKISSVATEGKFIASPMVGTMYHAASPEDASFVKVGDKVDENTVVCIVEAMKVMNEVKAGVSGTIAEILIDNAHPVEFGTKIFRVV